MQMADSKWLERLQGNVNGLTDAMVHMMFIMCAMLCPVH